MGSAGESAAVDPVTWRIAGNQLAAAIRSRDRRADQSARRVKHGVGLSLEYSDTWPECQDGVATENVVIVSGRFHAISPDTGNKWAYRHDGNGPISYSHAVVTKQFPVLDLA